MLTIGTFVLQWFLGMMVFSFMETKACGSHLLILDERFMALDKNSL
jgi:hypothetical protein